MEDINGEKGSDMQVAPGVEKKSSRGVMGWIRQNSIRRFKSREASQTPRGLKGDDGVQNAAAADGLGAAASKDKYSLAAMFKSVPRACNVEDDSGGHHRPGTMRGSQTVQSLYSTEVDNQKAYELRKESSERSTRSDPGDLSDARANFEDTHQQPSTCTFMV